MSIAGLMEDDQWELAINKSGHRTLMRSQVSPIDKYITAKTLIGQRGRGQQVSVETQSPSQLPEQNEFLEEERGVNELNVQLGLTFVKKQNVRFSLILAELVQIDQDPTLLNMKFLTQESKLFQKLTASHILSIVEKGFCSSCIIKQQESIEQHLNYASQNKLVLTISKQAMKSLASSQLYESMKLVVASRILVVRQERKSHQGPVRLSDFLNEMFGLGTQYVLQMLVDLQKDYDYDRVATVIILNQAKCFVSDNIIAKMLSQKDLQDHNKSALLAALLVQSIQLARFDIAVWLWRTYEPWAQEASGQVVPAVIDSLDQSPAFFNFKMFFVIKLAHCLTKQHQDRILASIYRRVLSKKKEEQLEFQMYNLNPLKNSMQLVELLQILHTMNQSNSEKVTGSITALNNIMVTTMEDPALCARKVKMLAVSKDSFDSSVLSYFEKHDVYNLLNTKIIKEVMDDLVHGNSDQQGEFLSDSTFWGIISDYHKGVVIDFEQRLKFKQRRTLPHQFSFFIYRKSVLAKIRFDFYVVIILTVFTVSNLLDTSSQINILFSKMYSDYPVTVAWRKFIDIQEEGPVSMMDPRLMPIMMLIQPYMLIMVSFKRDLTKYFATMHVLFTLNAISALRSPLVYIFTRMSGRRFVFNFSVQLDLCLLGLYIFYLKTYFDYSDYRDLDAMFYSPGGLIDDREDRNDVFSFQMMMQADQQKFRFDWLTGVYAALVCLKVIILFQFTETFGAIIKMLTTMTKQLVLFTVVWGMVIMLFTCVGKLLFYTMVNFEDLITSLTFLMESALGNWDLTNFIEPRRFSCNEDETDCYYRPMSTQDKYTGLVYMMLFLILNIVVIMNLVIAILSTTYSTYSTYSQGLYYDTIIEALPIYLHDKHYGALVSTPALLSPISLLLIPLFYVLEGPKLKQLNRFITLVYYSPIGLIATLVFLIFNLICLPIAYVTIVWSKIKMEKWKKKQSWQFSNVYMHWITFSIFGLPALISKLLYDTLKFVRNLTVEIKIDDISESTKLTFLTLAQFEMFEEVIAESSTEMTTIMRKIQTRLELSKVLRQQLFPCADSVADNSEEAWKDIRAKLAVFKLCKNVVLSMATRDSTGQWQVNINQLRSLVEQIRQKMNCVLLNVYNQDRVPENSVWQLQQGVRKDKHKLQKLQKSLLQDFTLLV